MKALVGAFNQEKALVGAFSVIVQPVVEPMARFTALVTSDYHLNTTITNEGEQLVFSFLLPQNQNSTSFQSASKKSPNTKTLRACSKHFLASTISFLHVVKNI